MISDVGDVVIAVFPYVDMAVMKRRPGLVLTGAARNAGTGETLVAMITTAHRSTWPDDMAILDWSVAGLKGPCVVRTRLTSLVNGLVLDRIGTLSAGDRQRSGEVMRRLIAL